MPTPDGKSSVDIVIEPIDDREIEWDEYVKLRLVPQPRRALDLPYTVGSSTDPNLHPSNTFNFSTPTPGSNKIGTLAAPLDAKLTPLANYVGAGLSLGICATYIFMGLQPMSDVLVTAWSIAAIFAAWRSRE